MNWFFFYINKNNFYFFIDFKYRDFLIIICEKFN